MDKELVKLLGCKVKEITTGYVGVVTSVSVDLVGCRQAYITPPSLPSGQKQEDFGRWYDVARLEVGKRVMPAPTDEKPQRERGSSFKAAP